MLKTASSRSGSRQNFPAQRTLTAVGALPLRPRYGPTVKNPKSRVQRKRNATAAPLDSSRLSSQPSKQSPLANKFTTSVPAGVLNPKVVGRPSKFGSHVDALHKTPEPSGGLTIGELKQCDGLPYKPQGLLGMFDGTPSDLHFIHDTMWHAVGYLVNTRAGTESWEQIYQTYRFWATLHQKLVGPRNPDAAPSGGTVINIPVNSLNDTNQTRGTGMPLPPGRGAGSGGEAGGQGGSNSDGEADRDSTSGADSGGDADSGGQGSSSNNGRSTGENQHGTVGSRDSSHEDSSGDAGGDDNDSNGGGSGESGGDEGGGEGASGGSGPADVGEAIDDVQREWNRSESLPSGDPAKGYRRGQGSDVGGHNRPRGSRDNRPASSNSMCAQAKSPRP
ncbi:MAG: hypothetical protein ACYC3X_28840 [Pirellulaceae bacterium]